MERGAAAYADHRDDRRRDGGRAGSASPPGWTTTSPSRWTRPSFGRPWSAGCRRGTGRDRRPAGHLADLDADLVGDVVSRRVTHPPAALARARSDDVGREGLVADRRRDVTVGEVDPVTVLEALHHEGRALGARGRPRRSRSAGRGRPRSRSRERDRVLGLGLLLDLRLPPPVWDGFGARVIRRTGLLRGSARAWGRTPTGRSRPGRCPRPPRGRRPRCPPGPRR